MREHKWQNKSSRIAKNDLECWGKACPTMYPSIRRQCPRCKRKNVRYRMNYQGGGKSSNLNTSDLIEYREFLNKQETGEPEKLLTEEAAVSVG